MQCPGQDSRYWTGEDVFEIECPKCGYGVEFFKDDSQRRCPRCGHRMFNSRMDFGCASYCPYAEQCLGSMPSELIEKRDNLFKDKLLEALEKRLDAQALEQARQRAARAEELGREHKARLGLVVAGALLAGLEEEDELRALLSGAGAEPSLVDGTVALVLGRSEADSAEARVMQALRQRD